MGIKIKPAAKSVKPVKTTEAVTTPPVAAITKPSVIKKNIVKVAPAVKPVTDDPVVHAHTAAEVKSQVRSQVKKQGVAIVTATTTKDKVTTKLMESQESVGELVSSEPMGSVTTSMGLTKGMANYSSIKFHVALTLPTLPDEKSVNDTYARAQSWVDGKISELDESVEEMIGGE